MSKINLKGYKGFKILKSDHSLEANRLHAFCYMNDIPLREHSQKDTAL